MSKADDGIKVLQDGPATSYHEKAPAIDFKEFEKVVTSRRSVRKFLPEPVPGDVLNHCIDLALLSPNSSNLQMWEFVVVKSPEAREKLAKACMSQMAARTAPTLVVALAHTARWKDINHRMITELKKHGESAKAGLLYYQKIVPLAYDMGPLGVMGPVKWALLNGRGLFEPTPRGPVNEADLRVWAHKSVALACQTLMLALRAAGYDSCPMEGFDEKLGQKVVGKHPGQEVCMVVAAGKRDKGGIWGERLRFERELFVREV